MLLESKKGVILAGGNGSRLHPLTKSLSKQLLPVFDKPMIYYPLTTLILAGVREILIICSPKQINLFQDLLGNGSELGVSIDYETQGEPKGLAEAPLLAERFVGNSMWMLILGDNLFHGSGLSSTFRRAFDAGAPSIWGHQVADPGRYGVVELGALGNLVGIEEKPVKPKSNYAVPGIYLLDSTAAEKARSLKPSSRNELEIADLLNLYLKNGNLGFELLPRGTVWLDTGTFESLADAGDYVRTVQNRQNLLIGSPEEAAWRMGLITDSELSELSARQKASPYGKLLMDLLVR